MIRIFFILTIVCFSLFAKSKDSCYSVQLFSAFANEDTLKILKKRDYPKECKIVKIENIITVRCGCLDSYKATKKRLKLYKKRYKKAYISTSYRYIFQKDSNTTSKIVQAKKSELLSNEELKLILQSFLYANDLKNAYKVAKIGYKRYPKSYYWNQKMAEISRWSGHILESIKYLMFMYKKRHNPKIVNDIIDLGLNAYQYEPIKELIKNEAIKNPTKKNIDRLVFIYNKVGEPEEAAKILLNLYEKDCDAYLLENILKIYLTVGDIQEAGKIVSKIEKDRLFTYSTIKLLSYYYYLKRDIDRAFLVLEKFDIFKKYDKKSYEIYSDLGWYLQKYKKAFRASLGLVKHNDGRLVDYERVMYVSKEINQDLSIKTALEAFKKFHHSYLFFNFAQNAILHKRYDLVSKFLKTLDKTSSLQKVPDFWLIKAYVYLHNGEDEKVEYALNKAVSLCNGDIRIYLQVINLFLQANFTKDAKDKLNKLIQDIDISPNLYLDIASLYYNFHDINMANFFLVSLKDKDRALTNSIRYKMLELEILRSRLQYSAFMQKALYLKNEFENRLKKDPNLSKSDKFLYDYLKVLFYTVQTDRFISLLNKYKRYLSKQHFDDLYYSVATKVGVRDGMVEAYKNSSKKEFWMRFANAILLQNHSEITDLLFRYIDLLPMGDASYMANKEGEVALSQTWAYKNLDQNQRDQNAYIALLNLSKERTNYFRFKMSFYDRYPLLQKYTSLYDKYYISKGYYATFMASLSKNSSKNDTILLYTPKTSKRFKVGMIKEYDRGSLNFSVGFNSYLKDYYEMSFGGSYLINRYFDVGLSCNINAKGSETTNMILGGKKDSLKVTASYKWLNSTSLEFSLIHDKYYSQDSKYIGNGDYITTILRHIVRQGYPDIEIDLFGNRGIYSQKNRNIGIISKLSPPNTNVLPQNFSDIGTTISIGMQNSRIYTRVWRPYLSSSIFYNTTLRNLSYSFLIGYGGKLFSQDHLSITASYANMVKGINTTNYEIFLTYEILSKILQ